MKAVSGVAAGARLGRRYLLRDVLGSGATATVWRADSPVGPVALKVLHPHLAADASVRARFLGERAVLTGLTNRHLVAVHDIVADGDVLALVLDLVDGPSLRARLAAGPLSPLEAAAIAAGVCSALATVHAAGVVHRDVKPENVLLAADGRALLTDFGVAFVVGSGRSTDVGLPAGTAEYVPPELAGGAAPTPAADVYAVGVLLYELLTGAPPFRAADPVAVLYRHVHSPVPVPAGAPPALGDLVVRCLAKDPADRPAAHEVAAALTELAGPSASRPTHVGTVRARVAEPLPPPARPWRRSTAAAVLAGVLGAGSVLAAGGLMRPAEAGAAAGTAPPVETYPAPTGWLCPAWLPLPDVPGAGVRPCVRSSGEHAAGRVQLRGTDGPVELEWSWQRWTGAAWQPSAAVRCRAPVRGQRTCTVGRIALGTAPTALAVRAFGSPGGARPPESVTPAVGGAAVTSSRPP